MDSTSTVKMKVYAGPSLLSGHPVVSLTIPAHLETRIPASVVDMLFGLMPVGKFIRSMNSQDGSIACSEATCVLTRAFLAAVGNPELAVNIIEDVENQSIIVARYYDPVASLNALQLSFSLARELSGRSKNALESDHRIAAFVKQKIHELSQFAPDKIALSLLREAESKSIPYRVFTSASRVWLFGHGVKSIQFFEAVTSNNGLPGVSLAKNKVHTNRFIRALGFPTTRCAVAGELEAGRNIVKAIGFPVVVKPVSGKKGRGVTANVTQYSEFEAAFEKAMEPPSQMVLIENHVAGEDFRLFVAGGRFAWATKRMPAKVKGDGKQSVQELINQENMRREGLRETQFDLKNIVVDPELLRVLGKQGFSLDDCPAEGIPVLLGSVANISTGGTLEDSTSIIHLDNILMAECVARSFRLDTVGIDFITPDLRKSWRECECAIIEVNAAPGFSTDKHAGLVLDRKFAHGSDGRIPIVIALNCEAPVHELVTSELGANLEGVGYVDANNCRLDSYVRGDSSMQTGQKVNALLSDPACSSLVIGLTTSEIEGNGLPVDRCAVFLLSKTSEVPEQIKQIIAVASETVIEILKADDFTRQRCRNILSKLIKT